MVVQGKIQAEKKSTHFYFTALFFVYSGANFDIKYSSVVFAPNSI